MKAVLWREVSRFSLLVPLVEVIPQTIDVIQYSLRVLEVL